MADDTQRDEEQDSEEWSKNEEEEAGAVEGANNEKQLQQKLFGDEESDEEEYSLPRATNEEPSSMAPTNNNTKSADVSSQSNLSSGGSSLSSSKGRQGSSGGGGSHVTEEEDVDDTLLEGNSLPTPRLRANRDTAMNEDTFEEIVLEQMPYPKPPQKAELCYAKLSGVAIEPKPFDQETLELPAQEESDQEEEGGLPSSFKAPKKVKTTSTIRWRWNLDDNGNAVRESNARFVKWSDGSIHLFVGKEAFIVHSSDFKDHHHLFVRQRKDLNSESYLQCHGILAEKLQIQPTTISHLKQKAQELNAALTKKRKRRSLFAGGLGDPERDKIAKEKLEEGKITLRQQFSSKRDERRELSTEFLEEGLDDRRSSLSKEKRGEARIMAAKRGKNFSDEEEEAELDEEMEDEEDLEDLLGDDEEEPKSKKQRR